MKKSNIIVLALSTLLVVCNALPMNNHVENKKEVIRMIKFMLFSISAGVVEGIVFGKATDTKETTSCYQIEE